MPKPIVALISWTSKKTLSMISVAHYVVQQMTGNANFPTPTVPLVTLAQAADRAETGYNNRKNGPAAKLETRMPLRRWMSCCTSRQIM
jgi:hypothetical protein